MTPIFFFSLHILFYIFYVRSIRTVQPVKEIQMYSVSLMYLPSSNGFFLLQTVYCLNWHCHQCSCTFSPQTSPITPAFAPPLHFLYSCILWLFIMYSVLIPPNMCGSVTQPFTWMVWNTYLISFPPHSHTDLVSSSYIGWATDNIVKETVN